MKRVIALLLMVGSLSAQAADPKDFDLGYVRLGMLQGQYRFAAWPAGQTVWCSDDPTHPKELDKLLTLPKQMAALGASRCALFSVDNKDVWTLTQRKIAGVPTSMTAIFAPDDQGMSRLVQLFIEQPRAGYEGLVAHFASRFGPATETSDRLVRWTGVRGEAMVMHEEGETTMGMLVDSRMQQAMSQKMSKKEKN